MRMHVALTRVVVLLAWVLVAAGATVREGAAFELSVHRTILLDALYREGIVVDGREVKFTLDAAMQIDAENGALDRGDLINSDPPMHVDNEKIEEGNRKLIELRTLMIQRLRESEPRIDNARALLGRGLHVLMDFYSHTNWIELGRTSPNPDFGRRTLTQAIASASEATCAADGATLSAFGLSKLTSGYYAGFRSCDVPQGKCRHGGPTNCPRGLAKDPESSPLHGRAKRMVTDAVKIFVRDMLTEAAAGGRPNVVINFAHRAPS